MQDSISLLDPIEMDILRAYLGLRTKLASHDLLFEPLDVTEPSADDDGSPEPDEAAGERARGVRIRGDLDSPDFPGDAPLANAVARICLNAIQARLPDWTGVTRDGRLVSERTREPPRLASVVLLPRLLLAVNWADSGPGFSWPESYHATFLPRFRRYIVTASVDCVETWGATDFAIGFVRQREELLRGCGREIRRWWRYQRQLGDQPPWAYLLDPGIVGEDTAHAWRSRTWGESATESWLLG